MAAVHLIIPDNRGIIRTDAITGITVYVPRAPFTDEITGAACAAVLMIETKRCLHRFSFATAAEAQALVQSYHFQLSIVDSTDAPAFDGDIETPLPRLPSAAKRRAAVTAAEVAS